MRFRLFLVPIITQKCQCFYCVSQMVKFFCLTWRALQKPHNIYHIEVVLFSSSLCFRLKKFWRRRKNQVKVTN